MSLNLTKSFAVVALGIALNAQAWDIYSNTNAAADLGVNYSAGTTRIGDEVTPVGSGWLNHIDIQYYLGQNYSGNEYVQLWLYENDGSAVALGNRTAYSPGTLLYASTPFNIGAFGPTTRSTLNFDAGPDFSAFSTWISGANNLTLAVQFTGIEAGEDAGVTLYDFPSVGGNYNTYWTFNGATWSCVSDPGGATPPGGQAGVHYVDFGMRIDVVPEPSAFSLVLLGGLILGLRRRFGKK